MSRVKGSKNKATIMREKIKEVKNKIKGMSQYDQVRTWFEEFGELESKFAEQMGWNTFRQRIALMRKNGYNIENNGRKGKYILISRPVDVVKNEAYKELGWLEPVVDYTQAEIKPILWEEVVEEPEVIIDEPVEMRSVKRSRKEAVLAHLKTYGVIDSGVALRKYDCRSLSHIIYDLRQEGYNIERTSARVVKNQSTKVDRDTAYYEYRLMDKPIEAKKEDCKYMVVSIMNGSVLKLGVYDDFNSANTGLEQAKELYVNAFNNSADKKTEFVIDGNSIIKVKRGFFTEKREVYATLSIVEV